MTAHAGSWPPLSATSGVTRIGRHVSATQVSWPGTVAYPRGWRRSAEPQEGEQRCDDDQILRRQRRVVVDGKRNEAQPAEVGPQGTARCPHRERGQEGRDENQVDDVLRGGCIGKSDGLLVVDAVGESHIQSRDNRIGVR